LQPALIALRAFAHAHGAPVRYILLSDINMRGDAQAVEAWVQAVGSVAATLQEAQLTWTGEESPLLRIFTLHTFPELRRLALSAEVATPLAHAVVRACPRLISLHLHGSNVETEAAAMLLDKPGLQEAHFSSIDVADDVSLAYVARTQTPLALRSASLLSLSIKRCKNLSFDAAHLPALRTLELQQLMQYGPHPTRVADAVLLRLVSSSPQLRRLVVVGCSNARSVTAAVLPALAARCPQLRELCLAPSHLGGGDALCTHGSVTVLDAPAFCFPQLRTLAARVTGQLSLNCPALTTLLLAGAHACLHACSLATRPLSCAAPQTRWTCARRARARCCRAPRGCLRWRRST
jgi:hypothetical protein